MIHGNCRINDYWLPAAITNEEGVEELPEAISYSDGHKYYLKLAALLIENPFGQLPGLLLRALCLRAVPKREDDGPV